MVEAKQITIIGTGLLGASLGLALRARGYGGRIVGLGRRIATVERARALGAVDVATDDPGKAIPGSDLAIVAVPLSGFASVFEQIAAHDHAGLVISDLGSTKVAPCVEASKHLPAPSRFCGAHPMAGSEHSGPDAADAKLFEAKPCIVTPEDDTDAHAVVLVESLWQSVGMKTIRMSPQEHDRQSALTSHLPHAVAALLVRVAAEHGGWDVASTGFAGTTRLASSNPPMRADIMLANREPLIQAIDALVGELSNLRAIIESNDHARVLAVLEKSKSVRDQWQAQHDAK